MAKRSAPSGPGDARRALITGASVGIGAAFAERLAKDGYDLVVVARSRARLEALAKRLERECGISVEPLIADLSDAAGLRVVEEVLAGHQSLDLLVNNAGIGTFGQFSKLDPNKEEAEIRLNVVALVRLTRAALPAMVKRKRGAIINVSSLAGFQASPFNATYGATKAFVTSFTESIHEELRGSGVQVQALCPGFTRTEFQKRAGIDVSSIPEFAWMTAESVVAASLDGLRRGQVVCVPGLTNRLLAAVTGVVPRSITRRLAGSLAKEYLE